MQNYANHARFDTGYHKILAPILLLTVVGACINLYKSLGDHQRLYSASLILVLAVCSVLICLYARIFPLKAQDRAIRAEENLRHYVLTGKLLDARLTVLQVVALRFAPDAEFPALAARAAGENMEPKAIKLAIKDWRADEYRV
jgi:uncharacterized membrane protein